MFGIVQNNLERLWQKFRGLDTRVTALENSGGGGGGGPITLSGDVNGASDSNSIGYILGQPLTDTLTQAGTFWTYDADSGSISPLEPPLDDNMVLTSELGFGRGVRYKIVNFAPKSWIEGGIFTNYVMQLGYHFYSLNFDSITGNIDIEFPPLNSDSVPIICNFKCGGAFDLTFTCSTAIGFLNKPEMRATEDVLNFIAYPDVSSGNWIIVVMYIK